MKLGRIYLLCMLLCVGCSTANTRRATPAQANSAQAPAAQHCPDRVNRTRAGGAVGGVVGFVVASALGSPLLGILYQVGGYAAGFSSADPCRKENPPAAAAQARSDAPAAATLSSEKIVEEDLK